MREVFKQEMTEVQDRLVEIAGDVVTSIEQATEAFGDSTVQLAEQVIASDPIIDEKVNSLDELVIDIIARQGPVARDLRIVISALRISASLERMGDLARHIALLTRYRFPANVVPDSLAPTFAEMGANDVEVARLLLELLRTEDLKYADQIAALDDHIDGLHQSVFDQVLGEGWDHEVHATVDATLASRYHERFADHAVGIAKKMVYLATGEWTADLSESVTAPEQP